jgi:hypothetical protein
MEIAVSLKKLRYQSAGSQAPRAGVTRFTFPNSEDL